MGYIDRARTAFHVKHPRQFFIDGEWVNPGQDKNVLDIVSPHTEEVFMTFSEATTGDMDRAVAAARRAFDEGLWPRFTPAERAQRLMALAAGLKKRLPELAEAWTAQVGAPLGFANYASAQGPGLFEYYADMVRSYAFMENRTRDNGQVARIIREPVGVVAAITPWNAPLVLLSYKLAPALAAGCTVVVKPAPETPIEAYIVAECAQDAGLPPGVLNLVPAGREVGDYLIRHPGIDKISFTGSTAAGKHIAAVSAARLVRVGLELGGKSAAIVLEDADIGAMLNTLVPYSMPITGQVCFSLTRVLVPKTRQREVLDAFVEAVSRLRVGDPFEAETQLGPLAMKRQLDRVQGYIEAGISDGAKLAIGGGRPKHLNRGFYIEPTVFTEVDSSMRIAQEEIFGPVVSFIAYDDEKDAIRKANDTVFGLHGAIYTSDPEAAMRVARGVRAGSLAINGMTVDYKMPFGGFKQSGVGREGGTEGLEPYLETKTVYLA